MQCARSLHYILNIFAYLEHNILLRKMEQCKRGLSLTRENSLVLEWLLRVACGQESWVWIPAESDNDNEGESKVTRCRNDKCPIFSKNVATEILFYVPTFAKNFAEY